MKDRTFKLIITTITVIGLLSTAALIWYTCQLRETCSIVSYVANGR